MSNRKIREQIEARNANTKVYDAYKKQESVITNYQVCKAFFHDQSVSILGLVEKILKEKYNLPWQAKFIRKAIMESPEVMVESLLEGTEITQGIYKTREKTVIFPITEVVTSNEFFDYDAKYNGQVQEITPARIPEEVAERVSKITSHIYDILHCNGIIRIDYIVSKEGKISMLEVNTTPGMTATSFIPQQVAAAGLKMADVLADIVENQFD